MILIMDNYDSFTYNLYQMVGALNPNIRVVRNDELSVSEVAELNASHIIISPGPGKPKDAGICEEVIQHLAGKVPLLGICLGHQAICEVFGAEITYAKSLTHGKQNLIHIANGNPIFRGLPPIMQAGRYHSLAATRDTLPDELLVISETDDGEVMGVAHRDFDIFGLQFHPESILTPDGARIVENFLQIGGKSEP
ncbi:MAG: aminodeoxychorismate/anthranilate synthase component II [Oscillospiraceae bacterium]|nr:aminodeoxychorismate/anthranilate synthase component II [Oscillospiraceae bacterium]